MVVVMVAFGTDHRYSAAVMDADDVFAAMGIAGFGKATAKRELDPNRFDKTKRDAVVSTAWVILTLSTY
jgi:Tfp pilus tip-associated adhesin PilY1